jgi:AcrR family transcriptional regulator
MMTPVAATPPETRDVDAKGSDPGTAAEHERRPGRPRRVEVDEAILAAAVRLLAEHGYGGVTMEGVASEAGVGKATLYRRWPSKTDLILDAIRSLKPDIGHPDTGSTRQDLIEITSGAISWRADTELTEVVAAVMAELPRNDELAAVYRSRFLAPRRQETMKVLHRGIERGDIDPDTDVELVLDLLIGAVFYRGLLSGGRLDAEIAELVVDTILHGIAAD